MARTIDEFIATLPEEVRKAIAARSEDLILEIESSIHEESQDDAQMEETTTATNEAKGAARES